jgi:hypothetical protein
VRRRVRRAGRIMGVLGWGYFEENPLRLVSKLNTT